jgi:hypothetical protein
MKLKFLGLAVLALACAMGSAIAQTAPLGPAQLSKLVPSMTRGRASKATAALASGGGATLQAPGIAASGWNTFHATNCEWYTDGTNNYTYILPQEGGYWYIANNGYASGTFDAACANGNWVSVYVYNTSTGAFSNIVTYPYK